MQWHQRYGGKNQPLHFWNKQVFRSAQSRYHPLRFAQRAVQCTAVGPFGLVMWPPACARRSLLGAAMQPDSSHLGCRATLWAMQGQSSLLGSAGQDAGLRAGEGALAGLSAMPSKAWLSNRSGSGSEPRSTWAAVTPAWFGWSRWIGCGLASAHAVLDRAAWAVTGAFPWGNFALCNAGSGAGEPAGG